MADKQVSVDPDRLRAYGGWLMSKWSEIDGLSGDLKILKITPGSVPGAPELKTRFTDQKGALDKIITDLGGMIYQTGLNITYLADVYTSAEDINKDDMDRLGQTIGSIDKYYAGASNVIPPADPTIPNPPA
jgi:hypothetical protein